MRVKCPAQELNTVTSIWPQLFEGHSVDKCSHTVTNHAIYLLDRGLSSGFIVLSTFQQPGPGVQHITAINPPCLQFI